ncbi:MAG: HNH endonuclease [Polyangiaceae bacterium]
MTARFDDCIYCGSPNGSGEHTVQAALGGVRTNKGILCGRCNEDFSTIDAALARAYAP